MNQSEPVAVPVTESPDVGQMQGETKTRSAEDQIIDGGLDHSSYEGTYGSPLVADHLGVRDLYKSDPTGSVVSMVDDLTQHLYDLVEEPMVFAMEDALSRMEDEMNIKKDDAGLYRLKQLHKLMTMQQRLSSIESMRKQAIDDIDEMM